VESPANPGRFSFHRPRLPSIPHPHSRRVVDLRIPSPRSAPAYPRAHPRARLLPD